MLLTASSACQQLLACTFGLKAAEADMHADGRRQQKPADQQHEAQRPCNKGDASDLLHMARSRSLQQCSQAPRSFSVQLMHSLVFRWCPTHELRGDCVQMRSSRNFCMDVILICIALAVALYIYNMVKKK